MSTGWSVGVDVGGTFTDLAAIDPDGRVHVRKVLSTPEDQSEGVMAALAALGVPGELVERVAHGTTVVTNLLLERTGARVVLCATAGASDLLELRRQDRAALYDLSRQHPPPIVAAADVIAVGERMTPDGVLHALSHEEASRAAAAAGARGPAVVAVSLLHADLHPEHERRLGTALRAALSDDVEVILSSAVLPEPREYERTATTVAEAYARPAVARYLASLAGRLAIGGLPAPAVMTSAGGTRRADEAARAAASLALSGPAGGVVGAAALARARKLELVLTVDIGGTSADVGIIVDGEPLMESGGAINGVPIALPRVLVETVSAGGGSVAWVDDGGALRVGPRSAGAVPGPAAFGRGGREATLTDAHVVLGHLQGALSGDVALDERAAGDAVAAVAARLGAAAPEVARAIVDTADAEMVRALRRVSVDRGVDPRSCTLVPFGGGGPLHACALAERLDMRHVLVPHEAGVLSALGLAIAPERRDALLGVGRRACALDAAAVAGLVAALAAESGPGPRRLTWVRARYEGQGYELEVPVTPGDDGAALGARFTAVHRARFGFALARPVEVVSARQAVIGSARVAAPRGGGGRQLRGPATVPMSGSTLLIAAGWRARETGLGWELTRDD